VANDGHRLARPDLIALSVKRSLDVSATLLADGVAAAQEVVVSPEAGANVKVTLRRDSVPQPPADRKML